MKIWVDADACPIAIKEVLYRAANRAKVSVILIANQMLRVPPSPWIRALQVPSGFDVADRRIVQEAAHEDVPLYWQHARMASSLLRELTQAVSLAAKDELVQLD